MEFFSSTRCDAVHITDPTRYPVRARRRVETTGVMMADWWFWSLYAGPSPLIHVRAGGSVAGSLHDRTLKSSMATVLLVASASFWHREISFDSETRLCESPRARGKAVRSGPPIPFPTPPSAIFCICQTHSICRCGINMDTKSDRRLGALHGQRRHRASRAHTRRQL